MLLIAGPNDHPQRGPDHQPGGVVTLEAAPERLDLEIAQQGVHVSDPPHLDDGRPTPAVPTADEEYRGDQEHADGQAHRDHLGPGRLDLVADLPGQLAELGLDLVTGDRFGSHAHGVSFLGSVEVRRWPRLTALTAMAAIATTTTVQIKYGAHEQLPAKVVPVSPCRKRRKATARMTRPMAMATDPATPNTMKRPSPLRGSRVSCLT